MSDPTFAWYHCGRCGALFKAVPETGGRGDCPECGLDPASGGASPVSAEEPVRVRRKVKRPVHAKPRKRSREGRRKARALAIFVIVWVALVAVVAVVVKSMGSGETQPAPGYVEKTEALPEEDRELLDRNLQTCGTHLQEFLAAVDAPARALHVLGAEKTVARMARHYAEYPPIIGNEGLKLRMQNVIHTPEGPAIETTWALGENDRIEAVFFKEGEDWKIDWDAFVRYCSEPWPLFLTAQGPGEGTFRVLARERIGTGDRNDEYIGLVLGVPRPGHPDEMTSPSPEVRVKRASPVGQKIQEAFAARKEGLGAYGSKAVQDDPDGMIRLHVRVVRGDDEEREFRITELLALHWLEIDEPAIKAEP